MNENSSTPAAGSGLPLGRVERADSRLESDPATQRSPDAWRPTFDLDKTHWDERAALLGELDRLAARVAELEAGLRPFAELGERLTMCMHVPRPRDADLYRAAELLKPAN